jgi:fimbrial chaperone protein
MWQPLISRTAIVAALAAALFVPSPARAATFSVEPIIVTLAKGNSSATIAITNQSGDKLRLQVSGFSWNQSASGEMQLTPTDDLVFFPALLTLDAGETRRVRVGVTADQAAAEKSFRVFVEELPSLQSVVTPKTAAISIRLKIGIPVFINPIGAPVISGSVRNPAVRDNALSFDVVNTGNTHFSIQQVKVVGKSAAGSDLVSHDLNGWYVLAGGTRHFSVPISKTNCAALSSLAIQVHADTVSFSNSFPDLSKQCGSVSRR